MPNIYVTDETKKFLDEAAEKDKRTLDGQVNYLCEKRLEEIRRKNGQGDVQEVA